MPTVESGATGGPKASKPSRRTRPSRIWESESPTISPHLLDASFTILDTVRLASSSSSQETLLGLRTVPEEEKVLLLTPVVPHPEDSDIHDHDADPFEPLGRALSTHHRRIRHVPYVPEAPLGDMHMAFLRKVGAVIVVCCEPTLLVQHYAQLFEQPESSPARMFNKQIRFIKDVREALRSFGPRSSGIQDVPFIVASTGPCGGFFDQGDFVREFDTVISCAYQVQALIDVADLLYGRPY